MKLSGNDVTPTPLPQMFKKKLFHKKNEIGQALYTSIQKLRKVESNPLAEKPWRNLSNHNI